MNKFNLGKVRGEDGKSATIAIGTVRTGQSGSDASVDNVGDSLRAIFDFTIPRGDKGEKGERGNEAYSAGSNVQITNGVISATDTTYSPVTTTVDGLMSATDKTKLNGVATGATKNATDAELRSRATHTGTQAISTVSGLQTALDSKVDKVSGKQLSTEDFTSTLKDKLTSLEGTHWRGTFVSLAALQAGVTDPAAGDYADVDAVGADVERYIWDATDSVWVVQSGAVSPITASQVKQLYESNFDTNAFTDAEKGKLGGIEAGATKNATDSYLLNRENHTGTQHPNTIEGLGEVINNLPTVRPVLDFDFLNVPYLDPRIEFTRASKDWDWKGREYGINEPVFSGEGLQMVGPRTNLLTQSSNLASTDWSGRGFITPNVALAPNGTSTAAKFTEGPAENTWQTVAQSMGVLPVGETYTVSAYFKKAERSIACLRLMSSQYYYDLETGEEYHRINADQSLVNKGVVPVGDGWFLVYLSVKLEKERVNYTAGFGAAQEVKFDGFIYQGDGVSGLYVWQPALKVGVLSPPVFTEGSQVTVARTTLVVPNRGELSNSEGSLILCVDALFRDSGYGYCRLNFAGGYIGFRYVPSTHYMDVYGWLEGTGSIVDSANTPYHQVRKIGFSYSGREFKICVNGGAIESRQSQADIPEIATLSCNLSMLSQSITYYNQALTPAQLQELTSL